MRKLYFILVVYLLIVIGVLSGCKDVKEENTEYSNEITESQQLEDTSNSNTNNIQGESIYVDTYQYKQPLNIIDDNYRNYYEIFVYSFYDSDGDGIGDLKGLSEKLDYINDGDDSTDTDLGFNGIWLMPIMPSTTYHKYDVIDYYSVDPDYGNLDDFINLVDECHERDINIIIDLVVNHTSAEHPWFVEATDYLNQLSEEEVPDLKACPYVGYYHFTKEYDGSSKYYQVGNSNWYYEAVFWEQMPDLALENLDVRNEFENITSFWLDLGVDGFRLDAAKEYYSGETGKNIKILTWFNEFVKSVKEDVYIVGEVWDSSAMIKNYYSSGITSLFNFPVAQYDGTIISTVRKLGTSSPLSFAKSMADIEGNYGESNSEFIDAPFISNHDTTRISAQCINNEEQMKMAAGMLLTMKGCPFVYYGEEIGMNSLGDKDENKRLPMQWSIDDKMGMADGPVQADKVTQKFEPVDVQLANPLSLLNYYKRAIRIRNENPEIARGQVRIIEGITGDSICAVEKNYNGTKLIVIYNVDTKSTEVVINELSYESLEIIGYLTVDNSEVILEDGVIKMPKYAIVFLKDL